MIKVNNPNEKEYNSLFTQFGQNNLLYGKVG
jgi:hypothetical protein